MDVVPALSDQERRARLARRHAIDPGARVLDAVDAVRAMTVLHATEPATVYLSLHARVDRLTRADVDRALYEERTLVKQLAMRRTLFVFPRDLLPAAWGSASARTAGAEGRRLVRDAVRAGLDVDGAAWLAGARARVLAHLSDRPDGVPAVEVGPLLPELAGRVEVTRGPGWNHTRVLTHLGATGDAVRGVNTSHWRVFRPRWVRMGDWLGEVPAALAPEEGYAALVSRWLHTFGPGTTDDLVWWLGSTRSDAVAALEALGAVAVTLEDGRPAWVAPDDVDPVEPVAPWAALLPVLDPTVMGWKARQFYLGGHDRAVFDRNGNAGTTAWWDGRIVGCWVQDPDGVVVPWLVEDAGSDARAALDREAERLTTWLAGERVGTVYPSPAMKRARDEVGG